MTLHTRVRRLNTELSSFPVYNDGIPLNKIFETVRGLGFEPLDEDGTPWSGFLTGRDGRTNVPLRDNVTGKVSRWLTMTWHKMDVTGYFEVVMYVS